MMSRINRRKAIGNLLAGSAGATGLLAYKEKELVKTQALKGNIRHAVCRWCYNDIPLEQFCAAAKDMGISAIDLVGPKDWPVLKKYGLDSSMCNGAEINLVDGWNDTAFHEKLIRNYSEMIPKVAEAGYKNLICFSGNRRGKDDETGWKNCTLNCSTISTTCRSTRETSSAPSGNLTNTSHTTTPAASPADMKLMKPRNSITRPS